MDNSYFSSLVTSILNVLSQSKADLENSVCQWQIEELLHGVEKWNRRVAGKGPQIEIHTTYHQVQVDLWPAQGHVSPCLHPSPSVAVSYCLSDIVSSSSLSSLEPHFQFFFLPLLIFTFLDLFPL